MCVKNPSVERNQVPEDMQIISCFSQTTTSESERKHHKLSVGMVRIALSVSLSVIGSLINITSVSHIIFIFSLDFVLTI